jgi:serine O-acetyltransferase
MDEPESAASQPGSFDAVTLQRLAHRLHLAHVPLVPRLFELAIFVLFNTVISRHTEIGKGTRCGYRGMSVLVHKDATIGSNVMIGPHVVIGGRSGQGVPRIGSNVYIGANVCILGDVSIGDGAVIGAGAIVLSDVPAGARAAGNPARILG